MKPETRAFYESAVRRAAQRIAESLDDALDLDELARDAALSALHFHHVFRGLFGETPLELHRRLRLERAAYELKQSSKSITGVAFAAGYETHESFTRAFRSHYGRSPSEFRQAKVDDASDCGRPFQIELAAPSGVHFTTLISELGAIQFTRGGTPLNIEIKELKELRVVTVPHRGAYHRISQAFARLGEIASRAQLFAPSTMMLAVYYDNPETTPEAELRSEAALTVGKDAVLPPELGERLLPAGRYGCFTHIGPYEHLGDAWARFLGDWLPRSGERVAEAAMSFELYRNTPENAPKNELCTELYVQLA